MKLTFKEDNELTDNLIKLENTKQLVLILEDLLGEVETLAMNSDKFENSEFDEMLKVEVLSSYKRYGTLIRLISGGVTETSKYFNDLVQNSKLIKEEK